MKRILIIKPGAIGDLLHLTPTIRALGQAYPEAEITVMVGSPGTAPLFLHNPWVRSTVIFDKKGIHRPLGSLLDLWQQVRRARYDLVINFQRSNLKAWLLASAALPCRVLVYHKARNRTVHAVVNHLETILPLGIRMPENIDLELFTGPEDEAFADRFLTEHGLVGVRVVALNLGASNRIKCWSPLQFAQLGDRLYTELGIRSLIAGGVEDRDLADAVTSSMPHPALDLVGKISLLQLGAILKRCALLVSGDTGPLHLATAVGTPSLALFGAIDPERTGPVGDGHRVLQHKELPCVPCNGKTCTNDIHLQCMEMLTVDEVFQAVRDMLGGVRRG